MAGRKRGEEYVLNTVGSLDIKKLKPFVFAPDTKCYYSIGSFIVRTFSVGSVY